MDSVRLAQVKPLLCKWCSVRLTGEMFAVWMMFDFLTGEVFAVWMIDSVKTFTDEVFALWIIYSVRLSQVKFLLYEWWTMLDCHRWNVYCVNDLQCQTVTGEMSAVWMMDSVRLTGEMFAVWMMDIVRLSQVKCLLCEWWTVLHSHRWSVCCVTVISVNRHFNRKCNQPMNDGQYETLSLTGKMFTVGTECLWKHQGLMWEMFFTCEWRVLGCQNFAMQTGS